MQLISNRLCRHGTSYKVVSRHMHTHDTPYASAVQVQCTKRHPGIITRRNPTETSPGSRHPVAVYLARARARARNVSSARLMIPTLHFRKARLIVPERQNHRLRTRERNRNKIRETQYVYLRIRRDALNERTARYLAVPRHVLFIGTIRASKTHFNTIEIVKVLSHLAWRTSTLFVASIPL